MENGVAHVRNLIGLRLLFAFYKIEDFILGCPEGFIPWLSGLF